MDQCESCGAKVRWVTDKDGKRRLLDAEPVKRWVRSVKGWMEVDARTLHFNTCPNRDDWRGVSYG